MGSVWPSRPGYDQRAPRGVDGCGCHGGCACAAAHRPSAGVSALVGVGRVGPGRGAGQLRGCVRCVSVGANERAHRCERRRATPRRGSAVSRLVGLSGRALQPWPRHGLRGSGRPLRRPVTPDRNDRRSQAHVSAPHVPQRRARERAPPRQKHQSDASAPHACGRHVRKGAPPRMEHRLIRMVAEAGPGAHLRRPTGHAAITAHATPPAWRTKAPTAARSCATPPPSPPLRPTNGLI